VCAESGCFTGTTRNPSPQIGVDTPGEELVAEALDYADELVGVETDARGRSMIYLAAEVRRLRAQLASERAKHLEQEPNCRRCGRPGRIVDHIRPHRGDESLAFDPDNLQTLCEICNPRKTREDRNR
jgi:5-methylcytosine-specific restriction endonuclease McrA